MELSPPRHFFWIYLNLKELQWQLILEGDDRCIAQTSL
jgi:hypothetical protein